MKKPIVIGASVAGGMLLIGLLVYYVGMPEFVSRQMEAVTSRSAPRSVAGEGEYQGAEYCGTCHTRQLEDWRGTLHSKTTTEVVYAPRFEQLSWAMEIEQCDGCHAPALVEEIREEGVTCEVCHGPGRTEKIAPDICLGCHQINAMTPQMEPLSTGREYEASAARTTGLGCVDCHMPPTGGTVFHGFSGSRAAPEVYAGVVAIRSVEWDGGTLVVTVQNNVTGHSLPTGAPENIIFLTVAGFDAQGQIVYAEEYRFEKSMFHFRTMPMMITDDTRLTDGEVRAIEFPVPGAARTEVALLIRPILWTGEQVEQVIDEYTYTE